MASNVSPDNPLGLEASELAASKRAKAAAAARAAAQPQTFQQGLDNLNQLAQELAQYSTVQRKFVADTAAQNAADVKGAAENAAATAALTGAVVNPLTGMLEMPTTTVKPATVVKPVTPVTPVTPVVDAGTAAATAAAKAATDAANALAAQIAAQAAQQQAAVQAQQQNAIAFLTSTYRDLGLGDDIAAAVTRLVQQGYTADTIQLIAQDPKSTDPLAVAFKARFPANAARLDAGLPVLSPAEYLATERSYAQVLGSYGLNNNFATNKDVFTKLLTNDISPTELNSRVNTAKQVIENTDPAVTQQLQAFYGLTQGDMIAHVLDPAIATPIIEKQISTAQIGAEASRYGANINQSYGEQLTALGITQAQAAQGFQSIASQQAALQSVAATNPAYLTPGSVGSALQAATFGTTGAIQSQQELERLKAAAANPFGGSSGVSKGSLMGAEEGLS